MMPTTFAMKDASQDRGRSVSIEPGTDSDEVADREAVTCSVLCSLSSSISAPPPISSFNFENTASIEKYKFDHDTVDDDHSGSGSGLYSTDTKRKQSKSCSKHLQLPMFLSKTYHMIDKCNAEIATWSENGDNFVVKNVEKFASTVLPLYFKHSNFSSFARQLNFYGFRKLRTDPILTSDVDPGTASYVRFYHEKFQRGKLDLLQHIKRATKADQHSKDDIDSLKQELAHVKETLRNTTEEYDRKIVELSCECNRRITSITAEYDKLAAFVHRALGARTDAATQPQSNHMDNRKPASNLSQTSKQSLHGTNQTNAYSPPVNIPAYHQPKANAVQNHPSPGPIIPSKETSMSLNTNLLHSLSQAAVSLQSGFIPTSHPNADHGESRKRAAPTDPDGPGITSRFRTT